MIRHGENNFKILHSLEAITEKLRIKESGFGVRIENYWIFLVETLFLQRNKFNSIKNWKKLGWSKFLYCETLNFSINTILTVGYF